MNKIKKRKKKLVTILALIRIKATGKTLEEQDLHLISLSLHICRLMLLILHKIEELFGSL